ncbi:retrovirus-related pol polyprotein from transposon TNT 1-94 [Tanacetum coccineum]
MSSSGLSSEHKATGLKHTNFDIKTAGDHRKVQLNELNELRDHAYENTLIYKEKTKRMPLNDLPNPKTAYSTSVGAQSNPIFSIQSSIINEIRFSIQARWDITPGTHTFRLRIYFILVELLIIFLVQGEPSSAQSTSRDVSLTEPNQVTQPPNHLRRWTKDHPLDNIVGNPLVCILPENSYHPMPLWGDLTEKQARLVETKGYRQGGRWIQKRFLNGDLQEEGLSQAPEGLKTKDHPNLNFYRLKKALYGLKQAPRAWISWGSPVDQLDCRGNGCSLNVPNQPTMYSIPQTAYQMRNHAGFRFVRSTSRMLKFLDDRWLAGHQRSTASQQKGGIHCNVWMLCFKSFGEISSKDYSFLYNKIPLY